MNVGQGGLGVRARHAPSRRGLLALAALAALLASALCVASGSSAGRRLPYRDGAVIVRFAPGTSQADRAAAMAKIGGFGLQRLARSALLVRVRTGGVAPAIATLRARPDVVYAEPDYVQQEEAVPNDPSFGLQWAYENTGQTVNGKTGVAGADEEATAAWDVATGTSSVVVAEVDSGVDYNHPDLSANVWSNPGGVGGCAAGTHGYSVLTATCDPMDDETTYGGHGTHVAGIIGASGNNGLGVTGVNWSTSILPVKWLNSSGWGTTSDLIAALEWVLQAKRAGVDIRVVNDSATFVGTAPSQALSDEIDLLGQNDILFVTAAGNTGENNDDLSKRRYPCGYDRPTEICVTASDQSDRLPSWANYGATTVDLAAPGDNVYSTLRNGTYGYISGGSMASPQVAGAAALVLARGYLSAADLKSDLLTAVDPLAALAGRVRTGGRLDICRAVPGCSPSSGGGAGDGTLGTASVGSGSDPLVSNRKAVNRYQLAAAGTVTKLSVYLQSNSSSGKQVLQGVVYADSNGSPGALLGATAQLTFHGGDAAGWYDLTLSSPLALQPGAYWIGVLSGSTSKTAAVRWTSVASSRKYNSNTYSAGASNPFGSASSDAEQLSLYATYS
jgi:subtilisin family serine protease